MSAVAQQVELGPLPATDIRRHTELRRRERESGVCQSVKVHALIGHAGVSQRQKNQETKGPAKVAGPFARLCSESEEELKWSRGIHTHKSFGGKITTS
jgi:hypothetical protein